MTKTVLKLGGSLMQSKELIFFLKNIFSQTNNSTCIVVPGGGKFAEGIREMQKEFKFSDEVAHKMALLSMKQYAFFLKGLHNNIKIIKDVKKIEENNNSYLWSPDYLLENDELIPQNWYFTSDSIALWLAIHIEADKLIMIKSKKIIFDQSNINDHINKKDFDKGFNELLVRYKGDLIFLEKTEYSDLVKII